MPSRPQLLARMQGSFDYERVAAELGIPPGLAYMIVTGLPADGSDVLTKEEREARVGLRDRSQELVNPPSPMPKHESIVEEWMKGRVAADGAMRAAGEARRATPPPIEAAGETEDVVSVIGWQHNQVKYLQEQLEAIPGVSKGGSEAKQQQRVSIVDMIRRQLSRHEAAEETTFWPAVRELIDGGGELADRALAQEQEGKDLLQKLSEVGGRDERFDELVEQLLDALRKHVAFEDLVLLRFAGQVAEETRAEIGSRFLDRAREQGTKGDAE